MLQDEKQVRPRWAVRLEKARQDKGFPSAAAFARHLGISQQRYHYYEMGLREPNFQLLVEICQALSVSVGFIVAGE